MFEFLLLRGAQVEVAVADDGPGVDLEALRRQLRNDRRLRTRADHAKAAEVSARLDSLAEFLLLD